MKGRLEFEGGGTYYLRGHKLSGGNLQSCKVKRALDERTFERIAMHRILEEYHTVEFDSAILVDVQYEILLEEAPHSSLTPL